MMPIGTCCKGYSFIIFLVTGILLFFGSIGLDLLISKKITEELSNRLVLANGTEFFTKWSKPPVPLFSRFYLFDVTNADEVLQGKDAHLREVGPFTFEKKITRDIKGFSDDGLEISVVTKSHFYFRPDLSNMKAFEENITIVNAPLAIIVHMWIKKAEQSWAKGFQLNMLQNTILNNHDNLFIPTTPKQLLMDGYFVGTMKAAQAAQAFNSEDASEEKEEPTGMYSFMARRNGSDRGLWTLNTGKDSMTKTGIIKTWNEVTSFSCWSGQSCNEIKGSEGAFFPPPISQKDPLFLFSPDLNGSIAAYFSEEIQVDGLKKYRFRVFEESLMAPLENVDNSCYCAREDPDEIKRFCHLDGIIDISPCMGGVPIVLSKPHFFLGSPVLSSKLIGIQPNRSSHESYFDIDPNLGLVTKALVRTQLNIDLTKLREVGIYSKVPAVFFPNHWSEDLLELDGEFLNPVREFQAVKSKADMTVNIILLTGIVLTSIGILVWFATKQVRKEYSKNKLRISGHSKNDETEGVKISFLSDSTDGKSNGNGTVIINGLHSTNGNTGLPLLANNNEGDNNNTYLDD